MSSRYLILFLLVLLGGCPTMHHHSSLDRVNLESDVLGVVLHALMAEQERDHEQAISLWRAAVALDPARVEYQVRLGTVLWQGGLPSEALEVAREARKRHGESPALLRLIGQLTAFQGELEASRGFLLRAWEMDPTSLDGLTTLIAVEEELGHFDDALVHLDHAIEIHRGAPRLLYRRVLLLDKMKKEQEAFEALESLILRNPDGPTYWDDFLARSIELGSVERVRSVLNQLADRSGSYQALGLLGEISMMLVQPAQADYYLERLEAFGGPLAAHARLLRIEMWLDVRDSDRMKVLIEDAVQDGWDEDEAVYWSALSQAAAGDIEGAIALFDARSLEDPEGDWKFFILDLLQEHEAWTELAERFDVALQSDDAYLVQAIYTHIEAENYPRAQELLQAIEALDPVQFDTAMALVEARTGAFSSAVARLKERIERSADQAEPRRMLAIILDEAALRPEAIEVLAQARQLELLDGLYEAGLLYENGQHDAAEALARARLEQDEDNPSLLNFLGYTLADENRSLDEAERLVVRALHLDPWNAAYVDSLGWVRFRQGRIDEAHEIVSIAAKMLPNDPEVAEHMGDILLEMNHGEDARQWYHHALEHLDDSARAEKSRQRLEQKLEHF